MNRPKCRKSCIPCICKTDAQGDVIFAVDSTQQQEGAAEVSASDSRQPPAIWMYAAIEYPVYGCYMVYAQLPFAL